MARSMIGWSKVSLGFSKLRKGYIVELIGRSNYAEVISSNNTIKIS